jgi:hypothetical protein
MSELQRALTNSALSSPERTEHRTWIKGRAATLLSHYWREDDDPALLAAIGKDWADVLEGIPQEYIQRACIQYQRDEPRRKPTPGAVYQIARALMPRPKVVSAPQAALPASPSMTDEQLEERKARADEIMARAGFRRMNAGGDDA